jgi:hypothetical protein
LEVSHGILDSSEDLYGKIYMLESSLNEMEKGVSQLNCLALLSEEPEAIDFNI